jgi:hypothetical protein
MGMGYGLWRKDLSGYVCHGISPTHFWFIFSTIGFLEWIAFLVIHITLKKNNESWKTIGLNWSWFYKKRFLLTIFILIPVLAAILMPGYYNYVPPNNPQFIEIGPASTYERLFFIFILMLYMVLLLHRNI